MMIARQMWHPESSYAVTNNDGSEEGGRGSLHASSSEGYEAQAKTRRKVHIPPRRTPTVIVSSAKTPDRAKSASTEQPTQNYPTIERRDEVDLLELSSQPYKDDSTLSELHGPKGPFSGWTNHESLELKEQLRSVMKYSFAGGGGAHATPEGNRSALQSRASSSRYTSSCGSRGRRYYSYTFHHYQDTDNYISNYRDLYSYTALNTGQEDREEGRPRWTEKERSMEDASHLPVGVRSLYQDDPYMRELVSRLGIKEPPSAAAVQQLLHSPRPTPPSIVKKRRKGEETISIVVSNTAYKRKDKKEKYGESADQLPPPPPQSLNTSSDKLSRPSSTGGDGSVELPKISHSAQISQLLREFHSRTRSKTSSMTSLTKYLKVNPNKHGTLLEEKEEEEEVEGERKKAEDGSSDDDDDEIENGEADRYLAKPESGGKKRGSTTQKKIPKDSSQKHTSCSNKTTTIKGEHQQKSSDNTNTPAAAAAERHRKQQKSSSSASAGNHTPGTEGVRQDQQKSSSSSNNVINTEDASSSSLPKKEKEKLKTAHMVDWGSGGDGGGRKGATHQKTSSTIKEAAQLPHHTAAGGTRRGMREKEKGGQSVPATRAPTRLAQSRTSSRMGHQHDQKQQHSKQRQEESSRVPPPPPPSTSLPPRGEKREAKRIPAKNAKKIETLKSIYDARHSTNTTTRKPAAMSRLSSRCESRHCSTRPGTRLQDYKLHGRQLSKSRPITRMGGINRRTTESIYPDNLEESSYWNELPQQNQNLQHTSAQQTSSQGHSEPPLNQALVQQEDHIRQLFEPLQPNKTGHHHHHRHHHHYHWNEDLSLMVTSNKNRGEGKQVATEPDKMAHTIALAMRFRKPRETLMKKLTSGTLNGLNRTLSKEAPPPLPQEVPCSSSSNRTQETSIYKWH